MISAVGSAVWNDYESDYSHVFGYIELS